MSPTHNKRQFGGMEFLLKVFKTSGNKISFSMSYGSSANMLSVPVYIERWVHALNDIIPLVN